MKTELNLSNSVNKLSENQLSSVIGGFNMPWDYLAYATCYFSSVAGGGDPGFEGGAGEDCKDTWLDN